MDTLKMPDLFGYTDYQKYLRDYYEYRKAKDAFFSFRFFANKIGVDAGYLLRVTQGKNNLSAVSAAKVSQFMKFNSIESDFFIALFEFNTARTQKKIEEKFEKLLELQGAFAKKLDQKQFAYFENWHCGAIRSLLCIEPFDGDYKLLAKKLSPKISAKEAKEAIELLKDLGLILRNQNGFWEVSERHLTTGENWSSLVIRKYQQQCIQLGGESVFRHPKEYRDISTMTINIHTDDIEELREKTRLFRQSLRQLSHGSENANSVYQVNVQIFPMSQIPEEEK